MWHISPECALAAWHWAPGRRSVRMGGGIRPESPKVAPRRRAESRRARSAVQRETTEWKFLIHQLRLTAPVRLRSSATPRRTESARRRSSIPRPPPSPPRRVTTNIIFCDPAFDLPAKGSGRIQSARPSMDMAGQNRKVFISGRFLMGKCVLGRRSAGGLDLLLLFWTARPWGVWWRWWVNGLTGLVSVAVDSPRATARTPPASSLPLLCSNTKCHKYHVSCLWQLGQRLISIRVSYDCLHYTFLDACPYGCKTTTMKR